MDLKKTGSFIAARRHTLGLTQTELAERVGVTDKAVSRWETGKGLPDTSLLTPLAEALGVSVGEMLAGEVIPSDSMKEKTDDVILAAMRYSKGQLIRFVCWAMTVSGFFLLMTPIYTAATGGALLLPGIVLTVCGAAMLIILKRGISRKSARLLAAAAMASALILETLPIGAVCVFAPGPEERIIQTFSFFSLTPFGYANFWPLLSGVSTAAALFITVIPAANGKTKNMAFMLTLAAAILCILPGLMFGKAYLNAAGASIAILLAVSAVMQSVVNSMPLER